MGLFIFVPSVVVGALTGAIVASCTENARLGVDIGAIATLIVASVLGAATFKI